MAEVFKGTPNQIATVNSYAELAFGKVSRELKIPSKEIFRKPYCTELNPVLVAYLAAAGISAQIRISDGELGLHMLTDLGNGWIADPTWQQFLPEQVLLAASLPKVLIARIEKLPPILEEYGLSKTEHSYWTESEIKRPPIICSFNM